MTDRDQHDPTRRWIVWLVAALAAWGLYHAVGAYLFNHDVRRGLVVLACVAAFVAWWLALLRFRARKQHRQTQPADRRQTP